MERPRRGRLSAIAAAIVVGLAKLKTALLFALHLPFLGAGLSLLLSTFVYGLSFGWAFGIGFAVLLLVHELGHYVAIRAYGMSAGLPIFIPFMGAAIFLRERPQSPKQEYVIAAAGPFLGTLASGAAAALGLLLRAPLYMSLAYFGFFLQAFNLIPVWPLDGGRMVSAIDRRIWWLGIPVLLLMTITAHSPIALVIAALLLWQFFAARHKGAAPDLPIPPAARLLFGTGWLGLLLLDLALTFLLEHHP